MIAPRLSAFCAASCLAVLAACSAGQPDSSTASSVPVSSSGPVIESVIDRAMDKVDTELAARSITISNDDDSVPKAEITPRGDFLVAGKPVPLTPAQRTDVLAYRQQLVEIARQGVAIGKQGATLGVNAASAAIAAVFSGGSDQQIRQRVETQTSDIRQAAAKICDNLPAVMASQQKLAVELPAFRPYADLTQARIDECRHDASRAGSD